MDVKLNDFVWSNYSVKDDFRLLIFVVREGTRIFVKALLQDKLSEVYLFVGIVSWLVNRLEYRHMYSFAHISILFNVFSFKLFQSLFPCRVTRNCCGTNSWVNPWSSRQPWRTNWKACLRWSQRTSLFLQVCDHFWSPFDLNLSSAPNRHWSRTRCNLSMRTRPQTVALTSSPNRIISQR